MSSGGGGLEAAVGEVSVSAWEIDPLPDFLSDHTLTGQSAAERLREYAARWVQLAGCLGEWTDRATFALRYFSNDGRIQVFLACAAHDPSETVRLRTDLDVILRAHRLWESARAVSGPEFAARTHLDRMVIAQVRQHENWNLWQVPHNRLANEEEIRRTWPGIAAAEWRKPRVIYPWWGPGGPFLLPMESLVSQPVPSALSIYLQPTRLRDVEFRWLALMAREAKSAAEQTLNEAFVGSSARQADPAAELAARLYLANLRRLSASPFLVTVQTAAASKRGDVALSLAGAVQSLVHEPAFERPQQEDDRLPSGATVVLPPESRGGAMFQQVAKQQYEDLRFQEPAGVPPLFRLADLCDAQGAATVFRLPVSVRGGVPGVTVRQLSPGFHPGPRETGVCLPTHIQLGRYHSGGLAFVPIKDLTKHTLITGFTGSGKTVTVLQLLHQLWADERRDPIPFLVIESAKQEYRGLSTVPALRDSLRIYTLGNETCVPIRLNPFELMPGVRVEAHLGKLQTCFEAAIPPVGPSSSIISESLQRVYERFGWRLTDTYSSEHLRRFPEMSDFIEEVKSVLKARDYQGEVLANLEAALVGRFRPLLLGSKGAMFNTQRSSPSPETLFKWPTVLEMNDLNLDDKALVTMFVLTLLREYRDLHRSESGELLHVTMVEEAHNILEEVGSNAGGDATSGDARHKAVQAFCSLLTEIRSLGEGLVIADQSPMKLARDAMRNTNLQIAHQLRDGDDRKAVANAMIMEPEQKDFLGKLPPGSAAVFRTGLEKATFVRVDEYYPDPKKVELPAEGTERWKELNASYRGLGFNTKLGDPAVRRHMDRVDAGGGNLATISLPFARDGCQFCRRQCKYRDQVFVAMTVRGGTESATLWYDSILPEDGSPSLTKDAVLTKAVVYAQDVVASCPRPEDASELCEVGWCALVHMNAHILAELDWGLRLTPEDRNQFDELWRL